MFTLIQQLPYTAVDTQTVQLLAEIRFTIQDKTLNESFFRNLILSADFWINAAEESLEVMCEYWSFIKAIYSQNPVQYHAVFPIHNLIDLMKRVSDVPSCCDIHRSAH